MRYKVYQSHANNGTKGKFYLRPVYDETVELDQLADHMASHNTPFSKGQLLAVLTDRRAGHFRGSRTVEGREDVKGVYAF